MTRPEAIQQFHAQVVAYVLANPEMTLREVAKKFDVSSAWVSQVARAGGVTRGQGKKSPAYKLKAKLVVAEPVAKADI